MRLVTVNFTYPRELKRPDYHRLLDVFEASVRHHIPGCEVRSLRVDPPDHHGAHKVPFLSNDYKLGLWAREIESAVADGQPVILADCDMLCTGDPSAVFDLDFDIAYTVRDDHTNIPLNGGILFVKPTDRALRFVRKWAEVDARMYHDWEGFHRNWRVKYAGMNQASFGYLLENRGEEGLADVMLLDVPTAIYNSVNTDWHRITSDTVFVHIKSDLRRAVLAGAVPGSAESGDHRRTIRHAMELWYEARDRAGVHA